MVEILIYKVPDASVSAICEIIEALRERSNLTPSEIAKYLSKTETYAKRIVDACVQLGLVKIENNFTKMTIDAIDLAKATKEQRSDVFKKTLIMFPPFILFAKLIMKGNTLNDSARKVKVIFKIPESENIIESTLRRWGVFSKLIMKKNNQFVLAYTEEEIDAEYLKELIEATHDEFKAQLFIANKLDDYAFSYLTNNEKARFIKALQKYQNEPEDAAKDASNSFESVLFRICTNHSIDTSRLNGIQQIADSLKGNNIILEKHRKICSYHSALRNAANHGIEREIGLPWRIETDASLELVLSELTTIRSILKFINNNELVI